MPYFKIQEASKYTHRFQTGSRATHTRRQHQVVETRNVVCAYMKRNDPVSRRFIQYIAMETSSMVVCVRDVATGRFLTRPPETQNWLVRDKSGLGRAAHNEWTIRKKVDTEFFENMEKHHQYSLDFRDYYDLIIMDSQPGGEYHKLFNAIETTLLKAHRFENLKDFNKPVEHILRTITHDPVTMRTRDILPGEGDSVQSIWDDINGDKWRMMLFALDPKGAVEQTDMPEEWKRNEADRLEDEVLFPWERSRVYPTIDANESANRDVSQNRDSASGDEVSQVIAGVSKLAQFEQYGFDLRRWAADVDSDDELDASEDFGIDEAEDEDEEWEDEDDYFSDGEMNSESDDEYEFDTKDHMAAEFDIFLDRERARYFKECWHQADLEADAQPRWDEYLNLTKAVYQFWVKESDKKDFAAKTGPDDLMKELNVPPRDMNRHVVRDSIRTCELTDIFFGDAEEFFSSDLGSQFASSMLRRQNQDLRARNNIPNIRSADSVTFRPASQWKPWDSAFERRQVDNETQIRTDEALRDRWANVLRPTVAHLYKAGVVGTSYVDDPMGHAACLTEPDRPDKPDVYFDYRDADNSHYHWPPHVRDPGAVKPLLESARLLASKVNVNSTGTQAARFSLVRLWSAPHFLPLMVGHDKRDWHSFSDPIGRVFNWKFVPKDMPYSEWSLHQVANMRLDPYRKFFGGEEIIPHRKKGIDRGEEKVLLKKDLYLVMAKDEEECKRLSRAVMFAINTRPWRLEVDPWKSFWNVDLEFLEKLDRKWWA